MGDWREQIGPRTSTTTIPPGAAKLPDPYHRSEIYHTCREKEEVWIETDTELTYQPPAKPTESVTKTLIRIIHTGRPCPEGKTDPNVAWPGSVTFPSPLPPPPEPPAKDKYSKERAIKESFDKAWSEASPNKPK